MEATRSVWSQVISYIKQRSTTERSQINNFLNFLTPQSLSDSELVVSTGNKFAKDWIEKNYHLDISDALFNVLGVDLGFRIVVAAPDDDQELTLRENLDTQFFVPDDTVISSGYTADNSSMFSDAATTSTYVNQQSSMTSQAMVGLSIPTDNEQNHMQPQGFSQIKFGSNGDLFSSMVDISNASTTIKAVETEDQEEAKQRNVSGERTFESFIVGDSNRYAFSAALGVAKSPGNIYNPLFIYGGSGLGKTHLLLAIANYIRENHPHLKSTYVQTSDFVRDFTQKFISEDNRREFERQYRNIDVILLDDVQYLENKDGTTNEVFQIFNEFTAQKKQIILSADRAPNSINLDERYKSRFASGITIDIQPPNFETKHAIFENYLDFCSRKIEKPEIKELFTQNIIDRIIELSSDNIRELEGATASLVAYLSERQKQRRFDSLSMDEVEKCISNVFMRSAEKRININIIQKEVETFYHVSHDDLISPKRSHNISYARQIAMYLSRSMTSESLKVIGTAFGGKDHTSVLYASNKIEQERQLSKELESEIKTLVEIIRK